MRIVRQCMMLLLRSRLGSGVLSSKLESASRGVSWIPESKFRGAWRDGAALGAQKIEGEMGATYAIYDAWKVR